MEMSLGTGRLDTGDPVAVSSQHAPPRVVPPRRPVGLRRRPGSDRGRERVGDRREHDDRRRGTDERGAGDHELGDGRADELDRDGHDLDFDELDSDDLRADDDRGLDDGGRDHEGEASGPRYHEVRQKSSHNAFQRHEALFDQFVYHRIRSLEFDIFTSKAFESTLTGDWFVYHIDVIDDDTHCRTLSQCLGQVAAFARAVPEHEVVTLWIDLKNGFGDGHQPEDLDALLAAAFAEALVRPAELLAACPGATTLQEAVTTRGCTWPHLESWRGRVIVMLTGGDLADPSGPLATYVGADAGARAAFVAPGLSDAQDLLKYPEAIVHNLEIGDATVAEAVRAAGMVSRVWTADDEDAWTASVQAGCITSPPIRSTAAKIHGRIRRGPGLAVHLHRGL
ncbi:Ca2+-dependent phosphoinositide-specific phospholipase C [Nannocystis pusilla]|uniref:Ca2+-dependent phosphoinositide-specific phospholipase C n=1 Tax=Nannocystis pusilla TaxID=889268 RepID=UPI003B784587